MRGDSKLIGETSDRPLSAALLPRQTSVPLAMAGHIVNLVAIVAGIAWAIKLPAMLNSGLFDAGMAEFMGRGLEDLLTKIPQALGVVSLVVGTGLLVLARREAGPAHASRAALGALGLYNAAMLLHKSMSSVDWRVTAALVNSNQMSLAIEQLLKGAENGSAVVGVCVAFVSILLVVWPEKRRLAPTQEARPE